MTDKTYNTVSKLQFPLLRDFCAMPPGMFMPVSEASKLDQRPFGSLYHREWVGYRAGKGFYATAKGRSAFDEYTAAEARHRNRPELPLSHYFDATAYGLAPMKGRVHVMAGRGAA